MRKRSAVLARVLAGCLILLAGACQPKPAEPAFALPPPGVRPAPVIIFFELDGADLSVDAEATIARVAEQLREVPEARVLIAGHADRTGTDAYNLELSGARAAAVRERLVAQGVEGARITVEPLGERSGLVTTPDGVHEPQNRRAEIFILPLD